MRRILVLAVAGMFLFTLAACGGGGSSGSKSAFCDAAKKIKDSGDSLGNVFSDNNAKSLDAANSLIKGLRDKAPSEIKGDMTTIADFFGKVVDAMKKAGNDTSKQIEAFTALAKDQGKVEAATKKVDAYSKQNCGFSLSSDTGSSSDKSTDSRSDSSNAFSDLSSLSDFSFDTDSLNSMLSSLSNAFSDLSSLSEFSTPSN